LEGSEFPEVRNLKIRQKLHCRNCANVAEQLPRHFPNKNLTVAFFYA